MTSTHRKRKLNYIWKSIGLIVSNETRLDNASWPPFMSNAGDNEAVITLGQRLLSALSKAIFESNSRVVAPFWRSATGESNRYIFIVTLHAAK